MVLLQLVKPEEARSKLMARVRQKGTAPELVVRSVLSSLGARYRLNATGLPGRPDIANRARGKVIFVHGCFWHAHVTCGRGRIPKRNRSFWREKLKANVKRDTRKVAQLEELGFDVLIVWGCQLQNRVALTRRIGEFWFRGTKRNARRVGSGSRND
jgi:DNA mismatch endonuclease (patch repair protein)